ncbi:endopeptidase La [Metamycoplasma neophronis]|uniref:Lon protease n=1 Tax=Metamycoplasma neophronis TaxID=872983 RepID=A0ABY2YZV3_9BACT|nr:endopeptidase La [Metamycoplasma neophronis]TPR53894.1 endopeptidase La [Metamycoplasma neophronis]
MKIPFIAIRNQITLPWSKEKIKVGKPNSVKALEISQADFEGNLILAFIKSDVPRDAEINSLDQIEKVGVLSTVSKVEQNGGVYFLEFNTTKSVQIKNIVSEDGDFVFVEVDLNTETHSNLSLKDAKKYRENIFKVIKSLATGTFNFESQPEASHKKALEYLSKNENLAELLDFEKELWKLFDIYKNDFSNGELIEVLNSYELTGAYLSLLKKLENKLQLISIENEINNSLRGDMEEQQRDFFLREKMRQIRKMLKDDEGGKLAEELETNEELRKQFPDYVLEALKYEQAKVASMMPSSPEANISKNYIDLILALPWRKVSKELIDINYVREVLDKHHHGLEKPKERILEFISVLTHTKAKDSEEEYIPIKNDSENFIDTKLFVHKTGQTTNNPVNNIPILTLIGPPGTGKTTLAKSIAEALKRRFIKVSLGGVKDESEIRGHRRTYVGAMPGKIISAIKKAGVSNPVILLDEIDKMSSDFRGDPTSAMLEVLDPEQNANFQDHYLDLEYDLSKVLFIATANYYDSIPAALIDRVELLELSTYTVREKIEIAKTHLLPKVYSQNALTEKQMQLSDDVLDFIVRNYTRESGVRELKRILDSIARKIVVRILDGKITDEFFVDKEAVVDFLGPVKFEDDENENKAQIGVVNGLAYTSFGGSTLAIEVTTFPGKEGLKLTGQLKDVMKESAQIALAYVRANAEKFGINFDFDNNSIHIHVPAGAIPKDGPSAGVTFTTSIISALTKKPVPANIGMTGEITLRGKVLPIGGLKEKSLAATQFGIKKIFFPYDNQKNLVDVPAEVKKEVQFVPVKYYTEIFDEIFK